MNVLQITLNGEINVCTKLRMNPFNSRQDILLRNVNLIVALEEK